MHLMRSIVMKRRAVALLGAGVLTLAACGSGSDGGASDGGASDGGGEGAGAAESPSSDRTEVGALSPGSSSPMRAAWSPSTRPTAPC